MKEQIFFAHETVVIDPGCEIGKGTKIWHFTHIIYYCIIGKNCNIRQNMVVSPEVILCKNVKVQNNVSIYTGVTCDDDVFLIPSMVFTNVINPRSAINRKSEYAKIHLGKGATIGAKAQLCAVTTLGNTLLLAPVP
jgi:UDP-2-acetamido-3-amino-2,3-dideoxy-glucuronate N-acetyltransferase